MTHPAKSGDPDLATDGIELARHGDIVGNRLRAGNGRLGQLWTGA
jgi:hypothetical protein